MKTKSERFVDQNHQGWQELRVILVKIRDKSYGALTAAEIGDFPRLYRLACADLARAKMLRLSPDVIDYLNNIVGQAHKYLYSFKPLRFARITLFFRMELPFILIRMKTYLGLSALFFLLPYLLTFLVCHTDPDKAALLVSEHVLENMAESYRTSFFEPRSVSMSTYALTFYIQHNISIAFFSFASGLLAGLGTIYFLIYNGMMLGAISGYILAKGYGAHFLGFVTAHSVLELSGLVVAGAAGLALGFAIIQATRFYKKDQLNLIKKDIFALLCAAVPMLACAALIEGSISPQALPYPFKLLVAIFSAGFLIYYFLLWPLKLKKQARTQNSLERHQGGVE